MFLKKALPELGNAASFRSRRSRTRGFVRFCARKDMQTRARRPRKAAEKKEDMPECTSSFAFCCIQFDSFSWQLPANGSVQKTGQFVSSYVFGNDYAFVVQQIIRKSVL